MYFTPPFILQDPRDVFTEEEYRKLSYDELIEHNLKKDKRIRKYKQKIAKLTESKAEMKYNYDQMVKRIIEHRKQLSYKDSTLTLYKRILEDKFMRPTDEK
jgi:uncharacterized protein (DUF302 family)